MLRPELQFDWHRVSSADSSPVGVVDARGRLRLLLAGFVVLATTVFARAVMLEATDGAAFRRQATQMLSRQRGIPGPRGRILARDGTVLAHDEEIVVVAMHYRYLEEPPNLTWLRALARRDLSAAEWRDPQRRAAAIARVRVERADAIRCVRQLCGLSADAWRQRAATIQRQVERISERVNQLQRSRSDARRSASHSLGAASEASTPWQALIGTMAEMFQPPADAELPWITVAEELDYHVMAEHVPLEVIAQIESDAAQFPGVRLLTRSQRRYPGGALAAHVLGHLGAVTDEELVDMDEVHNATEYQLDDRVGRMGVERRYEALLRGRHGDLVELTDHGGNVISSYRQREPEPGRDLVLTIDARLQRTAEMLLDQAMQRRAPTSDGKEVEAGGAIVVIDAYSGAVLAAASAPRFDPNAFSSGDSHERAELLDRGDHPLFDRTVKMAIPPGSVFKIVTAIALLQSDTVDPDTTFYCRGYLHHPDRQRCLIFKRYGIGHEETSLADSLARSCNVYYFHFAGDMGPTPLVDWALRTGFGRQTGIDLPDESAGFVPHPGNIRDVEGHAWHTGDTQALAIGQSALRVTPLQVARLMAAICNGGLLVTPHVARDVARWEEPAERKAPNTSDGALTLDTPRRIEGLDAETLAAIRRGLERTVNAVDGTAHATVYLEGSPVAGKTGTAETGGGRLDHAWFAGYAPADAPRVAFVVALEHAGGGAAAVGPVARLLIERIEELGYLETTRFAHGRVAERPRKARFDAADEGASRTFDAAETTQNRTREYR